MQQTRIVGEIDGSAAMQQAIYKILRTERYEYAIYDRGYGIELNDLIGRDSHYVCAVLRGRIEEALLCDSRISAISNWCVSVGRGYIVAEFTAETTAGSIDIAQQFDI